jgi:hypothetical protein
MRNPHASQLCRNTEAALAALFLFRTRTLLFTFRSMVHRKKEAQKIYITREKCKLFVLKIES